MIKGRKVLTGHALRERARGGDGVLVAKGSGAPSLTIGGEGTRRRKKRKKGKGGWKMMGEK